MFLMRNLSSDSTWKGIGVSWVVSITSKEYPLETIRDDNTVRRIQKSGPNGIGVSRELKDDFSSFGLNQEVVID